jgi:hypothetical protein
LVALDAGREEGGARVDGSPFDRAAVGASVLVRARGGWVLLLCSFQTGIKSRLLLYSLKKNQRVWAREREGVVALLFATAGRRPLAARGSSSRGAAAGRVHVRITLTPPREHIGLPRES